MGGGLGKYSDTDVDVTGLTSATGGDPLGNNEIIRGDGTTGIQGSFITLSDSGELNGPSLSTTTTPAGSEFTNQPANDGIEVLSDGADTRTVTLIGTTTGTDTVVTEDIALNGATFVPSVKLDWGVLLAAKVSAADGARTVTIREASGNATITTIAPAATSVGVVSVAAIDQAAYQRPVFFAADGATTKQFGLKGTDAGGLTVYDSQALTGTTVAVSNIVFATLTELYIGDLEAARTVEVDTYQQIPFGVGIVGGFTGSSTLTLDGDPTVPGSVTISKEGFLTQGTGTAVASAAALPLPTGRVFHVTGVNAVTSITSTNIPTGTVITIIFDDILTFTDGNNLKLAGNFVTSADDTITLVYDGTNWFETSRSVN